MDESTRDLFDEYSGHSIDEVEQELIRRGIPQGRAEEVLKLIQASRRVGDFLERTSQILPEAPENLNGDTVGDWLLAEELGRGGMATVYSATRSVDDKSQSAAVKILRRGIDTDEVLARFHQERGALATLQHPYIAGLLDFGTTAAGRPWFALEKVEGVTITDWCKQRGLSSRERVQLFLKVGEGVQYAHRHLVVHRDLKASNVLVDSFGSPKLLDFGIAKMLDTGKDSTLTQDGRRLLTPDSAAPEQILGDAISTATDVYGLGVLLFHLLAERLPFAASSEKARSAVAALDAVLHSLPPRPSSVESCVSGISSALDAVVLKALAKDPNQRYPTVGDLMADLNRFLDGRPVSAKRWAIRQRLFYWVRRHQVAASIWAALLVGLTGTLIQGNRAQAALNDAEFRLQRMHSFAQMMFDYDEILRVHSGTTAMRMALVSKGVMYLREFSQAKLDDPAVVLDLANGFARAAHLLGDPIDDGNLGDFDSALSLYERSLAMATQYVKLEGAELQLASAIRKTATEGMERVKNHVDNLASESEEANDESATSQPQPLVDRQGKAPFKEQWTKDVDGWAMVYQQLNQAVLPAVKAFMAWKEAVDSESGSTDPTEFIEAWQAYREETIELYTEFSERCTHIGQSDSPMRFVMPKIETVFMKRMGTFDSMADALMSDDMAAFQAAWEAKDKYSAEFQALMKELVKELTLQKTRQEQE